MNLHTNGTTQNTTTQTAASDHAALTALQERLFRLARHAGQHNQALVPLLADVMTMLRALVARNDWAGVNSLAAGAKALRLPTRDLDLLRAQAFAGMGNLDAAREALKEELRYFPDNDAARRTLERLKRPDSGYPKDIDPELARILPVIQPYTMVGLPRLISLFKLAKNVCQEDLPGDFAECGVAAGGTSALLAYAIMRHSRRPRLLYCFDSFSGMPDPGKHDTHAGSLDAQNSGWGAGTCAAPEDSLRKVCRDLRVEGIIRPVKGFFKDSLPRTVPSMSNLAMMHMDGDWYDSTRDILVNLYDLMSPGGAIQVDDYGYWDGCDLALTEFFAARGESVDMSRIPGGVGAWFIKRD
jgi:O-methyltransferase